ncbi:MAG: alkaline phosphatase family protein [bacterium]
MEISFFTKGVHVFSVFLLLTQSSFAASHVVHISIDGLYSNALEVLGDAEIPNFTRLKNEGSSTLNARTDTEETTTLPNHTSQFSGRQVESRQGHAWRLNDDPGSATLHSNAGRYIVGIFDVVHDAGLSTVLFAGKQKFVLFKQSWNAINGADDVNGVDDGKNKIDKYEFNQSTTQLVSNFISDLENQDRHYAFIHIRDPDTAGHTHGWNISPGSEYLSAIKTTDNYLGRILNFLDTDSVYKNSTVVILTSDHGGIIGTTYHAAFHYQSHTIPFYIWGKDVESTDLYTLNKNTAVQPSPTDNPPYKTTLQPIRNGDAANLASFLLGLPRIPGSHIQTIKRINSKNIKHK